MTASLILYLLLIMLLYDLSLHVFELLWRYKKTKLDHPFYVGDLFDNLSGGDKEKRQNIYQTFWTVYWAVAAILLISYLMIR